MQLHGLWHLLSAGSALTLAWVPRTAMPPGGLHGYGLRAVEFPR
jgi:hypothetical protein